MNQACTLLGELDIVVRSVLGEHIGTVMNAFNLQVSVAVKSLISCDLTCTEASRAIFKMK